MLAQGTRRGRGKYLQTRTLQGVGPLEQGQNDPRATCA